MTGEGKKRKEKGFAPGNMEKSKRGKKKKGGSCRSRTGSFSLREAKGEKKRRKGKKSVR